MIVYNMPTLLNSIWKLVSKMLSSEQREATLLCAKDEIFKYIDQDNALQHIGGKVGCGWWILASQNEGLLAIKIYAFDSSVWFASVPFFFLVIVTGRFRQPVVDCADLFSLSTKLTKNQIMILAGLRRSL